MSANTAKFSSDYSAASSFYRSLWIKDPFNLDYAVDALIFSVASGQVKEAIAIANRALENRLDSPLFGLVLIIDNFKERKLGEVKVLLNRHKEDLPNVAFWIFSGWANSELGLSQPPPEFEKIGEGAKKIGLNRYNQALYAAYNGDWSSASSFLKDGGHLLATLNRDILFTQANILYYSGYKREALALLQKGIGLKNIQEFPILEKIKDFGLDKTISINSEEHLDFAISQTLIMLNSSDSDGVSLGSTFYYQLANYINSENNFTKLSLAPILFELGQYSVAKNLLRSVSIEDKSYVEAQIQLAEGLAELGDISKAISILRGIENQSKNNFFSHTSLGDLFRSEKKFLSALQEYSSALNFTEGSENETIWVTYFFRGICFQEIGEWDNARKDYLKALELSPGQPEVLNYLGYSLIERKEKLSQALGMIEKAIERNPQSGYIVDSLAWGLYKLGRYEEALLPMKKAYELLPFDPIINDHMGDILWNNGKRRSAKLYWKRSLSFNPEEEEVSKIKKKIKFGMD